MEENKNIAEILLKKEKLKKEVKKYKDLVNLKKSILEDRDNYTEDEIEKIDKSINENKNLIIENQNEFLDISKIEKKVINFLETNSNNENNSEKNENQKPDEKLENKLEDKKLNKEIKKIKGKVIGIIILFFIFIFIIIFLSKIKKSNEIENVEKTFSLASENGIVINDIKEDDKDKAYTLEEETVKIKSDNPFVAYEIIDKNEYAMKIEKEKQNKEIKTELYKSDEEIEVDRQLDELNNISKIESERVKAENRNSSNSSMSFIKKNFNESEVKINNNKNQQNKLIKGQSYSLVQGSVIPSILITEINTDIPGDIIAQVRDDIYDTKTGKYLLIPKGSKLYGRYNAVIKNGQNRVMIAFDKLILPNTKYVNLSSMQGTDIIGSSGLKDKVDNHLWEMLGYSLLGTVLNFTNTVSDNIKFKIGEFNIGADDKNKENGTNPVKNAVSKIIERGTDRKPTIIIRKGYIFNILVNGDIELEKYKY